MQDYYLLGLSFLIPLILRPVVYVVRQEKSKFLITSILFYLWQVALVASFTFLIAKFILRADIGFPFSYLFGFLFCLMLSGIRIWRSGRKKK